MKTLPFALLAELTHRCPLHCVYCSNPLDLTHAELQTDEWMDVFRQAHGLGVVQVQLSGGEPLLRHDLGTLVAYASELGLYTHLVTSGLGLDRAAATGLADAGLQSVQVSLQADEASLADRIAGRKAHLGKLAALDALAGVPVALTLNVVVHALNIERLAAIVELCASFAPQRIELANAQYYGWALRNRAALLPTREQLTRAEPLYARLKERLAPAIELVWVLPDYYEPRPKPCMGGWASTSLTVAPDGTALPCLAASAIDSLRFESVRERSLASIWHHSTAFNAFRGVHWMPEPCRSCERRDLDHGGCRCQAFLLTGDAARTDPVCELSPDHHLVASALIGVRGRAREATPGERPHTKLVHRRMPRARASPSFTVTDPVRPKEPR